MSLTLRACELCAKLREWLIALVLATVVAFLGWHLLLDTNNAHVREGWILDAQGERQSVFFPGDEMYVYRMVCVDRVSPGIVTSEIVGRSNPNVYPISARSTGAGTGCHARTIVSTLPTSIQPGDYEWRAVARYDVNPLRTLVVELPPLPFTVVEKKK